MTDQAASLEVISIVDSNDRLLGSKPRGQMRKEGGFYRVTYILVFSSSGQLLVQRRTDLKDWCPGRLDFTAGGIVTFDEPYRLSAERETFEELGVRPELKFCFKTWYEDTTVTPVNANWGCVYSCVHDGPFALQESEVADAYFVNVEDAMLMSPGDVTPDTRQVLLRWRLMS
ncbi:MAG: NUDIX domain-containing protein [Pseudomonadota bacterium]